MHTPKTIASKDLILLALLLKHGPMCAYEVLHSPTLLEKYGTPTGSASGLYYQLHKLYTWGFIIRKFVGSKNAPDRMINTISAAGKRIVYFEIGHMLTAKNKELFRIQKQYSAMCQLLQHVEKLLPPPKGKISMS